MNSTITRVCLILLTATGLVVGAWAYGAPLAWYDSFPGLGMHWLPPLGPYNEHFAKDVGAAYLALGALSAMALLRRHDRAVVLVAAVCWSVFNVLHLGYHLTMLHMYGLRDAVLNVVALGAVSLASLLLLIAPRDDLQH